MEGNVINKHGHQVIQESRTINKGKAGNKGNL